MTKISRLLAVTWLLSCFLTGCRHAATVASDPDAAAVGAYDIQRLSIPSYDGTGLGANVYVPRASSFPGPRPTLLLVNSWTINQYQYELKGRSLASQGYLVMAYTTRGFWPSAGVVEVGGPQDTQDATAMIDWLIAHEPCDAANIGIGGISYGGGIALLAAAADARVKVVLALSGWGDLEAALFGGQTIHQVWIDILLDLGKVTGHLAPDATQMMTNLQNNSAMDNVQSWASLRSPVSYVNTLNQHQVAIFIANSFEDDLFPPAQLKTFFNQLTGAKMFYMDHGVHASSDLPGLLDLPDDTWTKAQEWSDLWLRQVGTNPTQQGPVSFSGPNAREYYAVFPEDVPANLQPQTLTPLNTLSTSPATAQDSGHPVLAFTGGTDSGATTGIPVVSQLASAYINDPVRTPMASINQTFAAVYAGTPLTQALHLRGGPVLTVPLTGYNTALQLVAYLYDVDTTNTGSLITYGVISHYTGNPAPSTDEIDLKIMSYDVPPGHHLALAIDTVDVLYKTITTGAYPVSIDQQPGSRAPNLVLPVVASLP